MYNFLLHFHSINRWLVLIFALLVLVRSFTGWQNRRVYIKTDNLLHTIFIGLVHLQFLTGLLLYFVFSPLTQQIFADFGASMKNASLRFWAVEHIALALVGTILAQVGRTLSKKAATDVMKHKKAFIFTLISIIVILLAIPFGIINDVVRPLWR